MLRMECELFFAILTKVDLQFFLSFEYMQSEWDVTNTGNGEPGTGVWEQVYSGNPLESSKWRSRPKKRLEEKQFGLR